MNRVALSQLSSEEELFELGRLGAWTPSFGNVAYGVHIDVVFVHVRVVVVFEMQYVLGFP